ncbi:MAG TPA: hypothetical protein VF708_20075 [Pyrinomonadaceae bacterium]
MRKFLVILFVVAAVSVSAYAQGKGVDNQNQRVRDSSVGRAPGTNGGNQDVGAGRGMDFGKGRTPTVPPIPNPYRLSVRRDAILKAVEEVMRDRKLVLDEAASKPTEGILVSQPYTFIKGAVVSQAELNRYADVPPTESRGWTRGRYTIIVEVQPIDGSNTNVSVNAKIEGRTDGATGAEWTTLPSTGTAEQDFLGALIENVTGAPPAGHTSSEPVP